MNKLHALAGALGTSLLLAACGDDPAAAPAVATAPPAAAEVPPSATASTAAFVGYTGSLPASETDPPLLVTGAMPPISETDEPAAIR